ncbi:hypothetical protein AA103193_1852 [Tanticharoenia sakaeratensis NBRC 103193]|nr:hypothetical protein AA103193_1852 [Tanticharoenia sakaeratensis NBRC 103193]
MRPEAELTVRLQAPALILSRGTTRALTGVFAASLLAGCMQKPIIRHVAPPNPFGNTKVSAVCHTSPVTTGAQGIMQVAMTVRSDNGTCALAVQQPGGGNYTTFGVDPAPDHGKAFLYNYDGHTYVTYTPRMAYAGPDAFTAILIEGEGKPRLRLHVAATVDATGVVLPPPSAVAAPAPAAKSSAKSTTKSRTRRRHTTAAH